MRDEKENPDSGSSQPTPLTFPAHPLKSLPKPRGYSSMRALEMPPREARVWLGLSRKAVTPPLHKKFHQVQEGTAASYLLSEVVLLEPLFLSVDGSERAKLDDRRCGIFLMNAEAESLNQAFTLLSQAFETERLSHTGNVFRQGFTHQNGRWLCLDDLRLVRVMKALQEIADEPEPVHSLVLTPHE